MVRHGLESLHSYHLEPCDLGRVIWFSELLRVWNGDNCYGYLLLESLCELRVHTWQSVLVIFYIFKVFSQF